MFKAARKIKVVGLDVHDAWWPIPYHVFQAHVTMRYKYVYFPFMTFKKTFFTHGSKRSWTLTGSGVIQHPEVCAALEELYNVMKTGSRRA